MAARSTMLTGTSSSACVSVPSSSRVLAYLFWLLSLSSLACCSLADGVSSHSPLRYSYDFEQQCLVSHEMGEPGASGGNGGYRTVAYFVNWYVFIFGVRS